MKFALLAWAFGGWCGTVPISELIRLLLRWGPHPPPPPEPYFKGLVVLELGLGLAGGLLGGYLFSQAGLTSASFTAVDLAATTFGAYLGGNVASRVGFALRR